MIIVSDAADILNELKDLNSESSNLGGSSNELDWLYGVVVVGIIAIGMYLLGRVSKREAIRRSTFKGVRFTNSNLHRAYLKLGVEILKADRREIGEKVRYVEKYSYKYFPSENDNSIMMFMDGQADIKSICAWLSMYLNHEERINVLYFLAGIAAVDGMINSQEHKFIRIACEHLELSQKDFDSVISMYSRKRTRNSTQSKSSRGSSLSLNYSILGVSPHASFDEVKKAYRKMVKKYHPDRMISASEADKKIAEERFIEIQKAYEIIEKHR